MNTLYVIVLFQRLKTKVSSGKKVLLTDQSMHNKPPPVFLDISSNVERFTKIDRGL